MPRGKKQLKKKVVDADKPARATSKERKPAAKPAAKPARNVRNPYEEEAAEKRRQEAEARRREEQKREEEVRAAERKRQEEDRRRRDEEKRRQEEERRRQEEERRRQAEERRRKEEEFAKEFRRQEENKKAEIKRQKQQNEGLIAARQKLEKDRERQMQEEKDRVERLREQLALKAEEEKLRIEANKRIMEEELRVQEEALNAQNDKLNKMRQTEALRKEMESNSNSRPVAQRDNRKRAFKQQELSSAFDDFVIEAYAALREPGQPDLPFVKIKNGVYRFGTRNLFLVPSSDGSGVLVRQGSNYVPFAPFIVKYRKVEAMKLRGMGSLHGFCGAGYV